MLIRRWITTLAVLLISVLTGCTLTQEGHTPTPLVVTATLSVPLESLTPPVPSPSPVLPSATPTETATPAPTTTEPLLPSATTTPRPPSPTPAPTRTRAAPTPLPPLDDGSGMVVPGTGGASAALPIGGLRPLPATLYYLSDDGALTQVWRLQIGLPAPQQLSFSGDGVAAFDVAPDGTLAYLTPGGSLIAGGVPLLLPPSSGDAQPRVTALAWSPSGAWLAYTVQTPGAGQSTNGPHDVDGLWLRSADGVTVRLQPSIYGGDETQRIFAGPLTWRPDSSEILARCQTAAGAVFCRVLISTSTVIALSSATLPPDSLQTMVWNDNGTALIATGGNAVLSVDPDSAQATPLLSSEAGFVPVQARQFAEGTLAFVHGPPDAPREVYLIPRGQGQPTLIAGGLPSGGRLDVLWDDFARQVLLVTYEEGEALVGQPVWRDQDGTLHDLSPLTGPAGAPRWGPAFKAGDEARVQIAEGDPLNLRATPGGDVVLGLVNGSRVRITGGPRVQGGYRWWRVQTPSGVAGWAVESIRDERGELQRTLLPVG